jgi:hypothetical protein
LGAILRAARAPARTRRDGRPPGFLDRVAALIGRIAALIGRDPRSRKLGRDSAKEGIMQASV